MDEILGLAIIKVVDRKAQNTMMLKFKFSHNVAIFHVTNTGLETVIFDKKEMLGILNLRSMGYSKIIWGILQQNLSRYYMVESVDTLCEQFYRFINTLKKEKKEEMQDKYPWLDSSDERKYMSEREILEKYVDLDKLCLKDTEKKQVRDMLYKYKDAFSLRDEIGTCPNVEVEIDVTDKSLVLI